MTNFWVPPPRFPTVPDTALEIRRWDLPNFGLIRVSRGSPQDLKSLDAEWLALPPPKNDPTADWRFHPLGEGRKERFCVRNASDEFIGIWLDHNELVCGDAYRVDFLKRRPGCGGLGRFLVGLMALRAGELGAKRLVFQPVPTAEKLFRTWGALDCPDWKGRESLPNLQLSVTDAAKHLLPYERLT